MMQIFTKSTLLALIKIKKNPALVSYLFRVKLFEKIYKESTEHFDNIIKYAESKLS